MRGRGGNHFSPSPPYPPLAQHAPLSLVVTLPKAATHRPFRGQFKNTSVTVLSLPSPLTMDSSAPEHLFTTKRLISTFFRKSEHELSRLTEKSPLESERCEASDVAEVIFFSPSNVKEGILLTLP